MRIREEGPKEKEKVLRSCCWFTCSHILNGPFEKEKLWGLKFISKAIKTLYERQIQNLMDRLSSYCLEAAHWLHSSSIDSISKLCVTTTNIWMNLTTNVSRLSLYELIEFRWNRFGSFFPLEYQCDGVGASLASLTPIMFIFASVRKSLKRGMITAKRSHSLSRASRRCFAFISFYCYFYVFMWRRILETLRLKAVEEENNFYGD